MLQKVEMGGTCSTSGTDKIVRDATTWET